jgi:hypothetical protein
LKKCCPTCTQYFSQGTRHHGRLKNREKNLKVRRYLYMKRVYLPFPDRSLWAPK